MNAREDPEQTVERNCAWLLVLGVILLCAGVIGFSLLLQSHGAGP